MSSEWSRKRRSLEQYLVNRRSVLKGGLAAGAALAVPGVAGRALAAPEDPLHFVGWQYNPQIVAENVETFKTLNDENVNYELVPGEYHAVVETKLIAGQHIDMMYSEEDRILRWNRAGWSRSLDGLPGLDEIKANMYDVNVHNMSLPDGSLGGMPYYTGFNSFVCNQNHLDAAGIEPPATWDELLDQCRKLKTDGISDYPYISAWTRQWPTLSWSLFAAWYSEGAKVFDENFDPAFDENFRKILEVHRTLYDEGLVVPDIMTLQGEAVPNFATGQHTYMIVHEYDQKVFNTPELSQIAGACRNAIMPGKTRSTFIWTAVYQMGANPVDELRAWDLMQFFGGKAKDGKYPRRHPLGPRFRPRHATQGGHRESRSAGCLLAMEGLGGRDPAARNRDHARRRQDHVVPGVGLVHDGRNAGLHPWRTIHGRGHRQAACQGGRAEGALSGLILIRQLFRLLPPEGRERPRRKSIDGSIKTA